jgi:hypothetical protein
MESKYTKGPWKVADYNNCLAVECDVNGVEHTIVTDQFCYPNFAQYGDIEKLANAKLIAAAPELLEALIEMTELFNRIHGRAVIGAPIRYKAGKAILKATSI